MGKMNMRRISEGLIAALIADEGLYLYEIMDQHEARGLLVPGVSCPCDSVAGDDDDHLFILAFLEVLRHHINLGQIEGNPDGEAEERAWEKWRIGELKARRLHRPDDWIDPSCEEILPKAFRVISQTPLRLSDEARKHLETERTLESTRNRLSATLKHPLSMRPSVRRGTSQRPAPTDRSTWPGRSCIWSSWNRVFSKKD